jgi:tape measure domain-containing protein
MADYDAKIRVSADTKQAESQLKQLQDKLNSLSRAAGTINTGSVEAGIRRVGNVAQNVGTEVRNIFSRGLFAGAILGAGQLGTSISSAASNLGPFTGAVKAAGAAFSSSLGGAPALIGDILNQIGQVPNAMGLAAVAAMAFAPQILKASSAAVGLGAAIDTAVGKQATQAIANAVSKVTELKTELNATQTAFKDLIKGSTLNQLNKQLQDATYQAGEYHSTTVEAVTAANQLAVVLRAQRAEQQAITDLARQAQGLRPQSVENRATNTYNTTQRRKAYESEQLNKFNNEIDEYNRLAVEAAANTKAWEDKLTAITRVAGAGPLGTKSQLSTRVQEFLANKQSAQIARETSAAAMAREQMLTGGQYGLDVLPAGRTLSPGGSTVAAQKQYRDLLNQTATIQNAVAAAAERTGRSQRQLKIASIGTAKSTAQRLQISTVQNKVDAQSIAIARARNLELAKELGIEVNIGKAAANKNKARGGGLGKGAAGALSNAAIGGAFPLLFGQSGAAAAGGALGGIAGSFLGPSGGFAGSLVGTILGEKLGQGNQVKQLGEDIGFSAEQTKMLGVAFQQAGRDFDKFQQSVSTIQGLSLSIEDQGRAIQLASSLTESYKGKIDKVTNAFANALSTGKVTQGTLNQLTGQGIPIQQALADKYGVSRDAILKMAKDGKVSVQDLIDTLVEVGNKGQASATTQADAFSDAYAKIEPLVKRLETLFEGLFKFISDKLSSTLTEVLGTIDNIITGIEALANFIGPKFDSLATTVSDSLANIKVPPWLASFMRQGATDFVLGAIPGGSGLAVLNQVGKDVNKSAGVYGKYISGSEQQAIKPQLESLDAPSQAAPSGGSSGAADKAAKAAEREAARVANIVRDRAAATEQLRLQMQYSHGIFAAETAKDPLLKMELELQQKIGEISLDYSKQINDEKAKGNSAAVKEAITQHALAKTEAERLKYAMDVKKLEFERKENYDNVLMDLDQELQLRSATTEEARNQLRIAYEMAKLDQTKMYNTDQLAAIQSRKQQLAAPKTPYETIDLARGAASDELTKLLDVGNQIVTIGDAIGTSFGESFKGIISGTMTAQEALASFFQSVADAFLDMAAQIIAKWIQMTILNSILSLFPGGGLAKSGGSGFDMGGINNTGLGTFNPGNSFPGLATGGPAMANTPYIVGERGPELFMPGRSGTVIPNDALGGGSTSVVVNVDASGNSNVQGDQAQAKQLGVAVSAAVQAELVKQQRPGGLLAGTRR